MVQDFNCNGYNSTDDMCNYFGISVDIFSNRIAYGWSLKDALTIKEPGKKYIRDKCGNKFPSINALCEYYNITAEQYNGQKSHKTVKKSKNHEVKPKSDITDHLGNKFSTYKDLCTYHNISYGAFEKRLSRDNTIEQAINSLSNRRTRSKPCNDTMGNDFNSLKEMCEHYNIEYQRYAARIRKGMSVKDALTKNVVKKNKWGYTKLDFEMLAKEHNINLSTLRKRLNTGVPLDIALSDKFESYRSQSVSEIKDHLGNKFSSCGAMCRFHKIRYSKYMQRIYNGWSVERALTTK